MRLFSPRKFRGLCNPTSLKNVGWTAHFNLFKHVEGLAMPCVRVAGLVHVRQC